MTRAVDAGASSRRTAFRALAALAATVPLIRWESTAAAPCLEPGKRRRRGAQCCSGLCHGPKGKRRCRSVPGQGICTTQQNVCSSADSDLCSAGGVNNCRCLVTTAGASFCGLISSRDCTPCTSNSACAAVTGPGSSCVRNLDDACCPGTTTACVPSCPDPA